MVIATETKTPVAQIIELTLLSLRRDGVDGATLWELISLTKRGEKAVRRGLGQLVDTGIVNRVERIHETRNCPIAVLYRLAE